MTVKETGKVVWDTNATQTVPLLSATYTLFVVDSEKDLDDTASAGHLSSNIGYNFGMYLSQGYTPLNGKSLTEPVQCHSFRSFAYLL
jgi:hypothetical protein